MWWRPTIKKKAARVKFYINNVTGDWWQGLTGTSDTTPLGLLTSLETIPDIFTVTDYITNIIANLPVKFVNRLGRESRSTELRQLHAEPNYYQNFRELIKQFFAYYEVLGNSYLYAIVPDGMQTVSSLHVLPAQFMGVVLLNDKKMPDWMNEVLAYKLSINGQDYGLAPEVVMHKRTFSTQYLDGAYIYGISKYIPGDKLSQELKAIYDAKTSIISHYGAFGVLSNESEIPDAEESKEIKEKLRTKFGIGSAQDKFIVTTQKLSWQQMSMAIDDLQIIENSKLSFAKICQLNGIDPVIFSTEGSTFANKEMAEKAMMKKVIKPKVDDFYNDFNTWIKPYFNGDMIVPDWSQVDELQADLKSLTDIYTRQIESGIITPYNAAIAMFGQVDESNPPLNEYFRKTSLVKINEPAKAEQPDILKPDEETQTEKWK